MPHTAVLAFHPSRLAVCGMIVLNLRPCNIHVSYSCLEARYLAWSNRLAALHVGRQQQGLFLVCVVCAAMLCPVPGVQYVTQYVAEDLGMHNMPPAQLPGLAHRLHLYPHMHVYAHALAVRYYRR